MNALVMNCSPVRNGATAEIVRIVSHCPEKRYDTRSICIMEIQCCGRLGLCSIENRPAVEPRKNEIIAFCQKI